MGSENASNPEQSPCHEVHLPDYFIGKYPVTVAQFNAFVKSTGYKTTAEQKGSAFTFSWYTRRVGAVRTDYALKKATASKKRNQSND